MSSFGIAGDAACSSGDSAELVSDSEPLHDMEWICGLIDARVPEPNRPKAYRKQSNPS